MIKEVICGMGIGILIFLVLIGYNVLPVFLLAGIGILTYLAISQRGLLGATHAKRYSGAVQTISFADVGGQEPAKNEVKEALEFIVKAEVIDKMGIRPLRGILLTGPPGTGKTLLAKAAATYTEAVFIATSGSEFIEMYAGVGAQRVRGLFKKARETAQREKKENAIVFIDEIEVVAGKRGSSGSSHMEYDQTLNQFLVEMDGIQSDDNVRVLVIGATNREDMLDPALLRPGRFDRQVKVDLPDKSGRLEILKIHVNNKPLAEDVNLEELARETFGFSGAHLESACNEAAILALREDSATVSQHHFREAVDKVMLGEKLDTKPTPEEIYRIAVHETGHALISEILVPDSVSHVTITSRGNALGYTRHNPNDDPYLYTKEYLENQIKILLAGSAAEQVLLGNKSTGAYNDFKEAVKAAKQIIAAGLSSLGVVSVEDLEKQVIQQTVSEIICGEEEKTVALLKEHRGVMEEMVASLQKKESLDAEEIQGLIGRRECA